MPSTPRIAIAAAALALSAVAGVASARSKSQIQINADSGANMQQEMIHSDHFMGRAGFMAQPDFTMSGQPLGASTAPAATQPGAISGSSVAIFNGDVLVVDAASGMLIRTDADGTKQGALKIGQSASQLVVDAASSRAFVVDRSGDRIVTVDLSQGLLEVDSFSTDTEPFGVALSPDRSKLLVTSVADKTLAAIDLSTGFEAWSLTVGPEPRGVSFSPDGKEALVTFLTTGVVGRVDLSRTGDPRMSFVSLDPAAPSAGLDANGRAMGMGAVKADDQGKGFARNAFAAIYVGNDMAVVPHQLSTPHAGGAEFEGGGGGYGGGGNFAAPITHRLAFLGMPDQGETTAVRTGFAATNVHQPRAAAYSAATDTLFVVGYGSDDVLAVGDVSQASVHMSWKRPLSMASGCGASGIAVDERAGEVVVYCSLSRKTKRLQADTGLELETNGTSPELAKSHLSASEQRGEEIFRRGNSTLISTGGAMACASCHAEGRADGLTWFLQGNVFQTPFLSGRVMGSHPFKWDGKDADITASLTNTIARLGGTGLSKSDIKDLTAFVASMPQPRTPAAEEPAAVARGKHLFESDATGCADCHNGALLTDQKSHEIASDLPAVDTPSLIGLASSAPYYHDGSAPTLSSLLRGKGSVHGMGRTSKLDAGQVGDLVAYMESL